MPPHYRDALGNPARLVQAGGTSFLQCALRSLVNLQWHALVPDVTPGSESAVYAWVGRGFLYIGLASHTRARAQSCHGGV
eukprot:6180573-Pyramimonas_sp.AAC.1